MSEVTNKISKEALQKALQTLGLEDETPAATEEVKVEEVKKAEDPVAIEKAKLEAEMQEALKKAEDIKAKLEAKVETPAPVAATPAVDVDKIVEAITKGMNEKMKAVGLLIKSKDEQIESLSKAVEEISEFNAQLGQRLNMVEQQPLERKSLSGAKYIERFDKGGNDPKEEVISLSNLPQRDALVEKMYKAVQDAGFDEKTGYKDTQFFKAIRTIEQTGHLAGTAAETDQLVRRIKKDFNVIVTK